MYQPNPEPNTDGPREAARRELDEAVRYDPERQRAWLAQLADVDVETAQELGF